jgi:hypothetical protein
VITPWRSALSYAAIVTLASLAVGEVVSLLYFALDFDAWAKEAFRSPDQLVFPAAAIAVLTGVRMRLPALSRWRTAVIDTSVYTFVLLVVEITRAAVAGDEQPVDWGFVMLIVAMYNLQLPAALGLSAWRYERLVPVVSVRA